MGQVVFKVAQKGKSGGLILFQTAAPGSRVPRAAGVAGLAKSARALQQEIEPVAAMAEVVLNSLKKLSPGKVSIEFGVEVGGAVGIPLVTTGTAQANLKVTLTWDGTEK